MKTRQKIEKSHAIASEHGAALVIAILSLLLVTVLAFALVSTGLISRDISLNTRQQTEAFYISETGLTHGTKLLSQAATSQFTSILQAGDGIANTGDELSTRPSALTPIPLAGITFGSGRYRVFVSDDPADTDGNPNVDSNNRLVVTSIGTGADGATVTTEAILAVSSLPAILINGHALINGDPIISGAAGSIHANLTLTISGGPCVSQTASASSTVTIGGSLEGGAGCTGAGVSTPNQPIITPPHWDIPADFLARADYILGYDGRVRLQNGTLLPMSGSDWTIPNTGGNGKFSWDSGGKRWVHGGSAVEGNKTYYSAGNMELGSTFGTQASPAVATFVAVGYLSVSGNPFVRNFLDNKYAFMAGTDLLVSGNPSSGGYSSQGIHYAGHQIKFNGNPGINGVIIAENLADTNSIGCGCNPVPLASGRMEISGNPTVHYDGSLIAGGSRLLSWREVRR